MPPAIEITEFTDPACPFAWSAEPIRRRLQWLYGDQLTWQPRMVGLHESRAAMERSGATPERFAEGQARLAETYRMPMDTRPVRRLVPSIPACRAVVAVRLHRPDAERAMLRALRVLHFSREPIDEDAVLRRAARRAGVRAADLKAWTAEPATRRALREDMDAARSPSPTALALPDKLSELYDEEGERGYRYTCPSYELRSGGLQLSVPGFQPLAASLVAIANLAPTLRRRANPRSVSEVLRWAGEPLATAEVAAVCELEVDEARAQLGRVASEQHLGFEGLWSLGARGRGA